MVQGQLAHLVVYIYIGHSYHGEVDTSGCNQQGPIGEVIDQVDCWPRHQAHHDLGEAECQCNVPRSLPNIWQFFHELKMINLKVLVKRKFI